MHPVPAPTPSLPPLPGLSSLGLGSSGSLRVSPPPQGPDAVPASPFHTLGASDPIVRSLPLRGDPLGMSGEAPPPRTGSLQADPDPPRTCPTQAIRLAPRDSLPGRSAAGGPLNRRRGRRRRGEQGRRVRRTAALIPRPPLLRAVRWGVCRSRAGV